MDAIALGCLTALLVSRVHFSRAILRAACMSGAALLVFILCFSVHAESLGLARYGLDMSILAAGTCLVIVAAAQTQWRSPRLLGPFLNLGRRSYEIYLTHMFVVFAGFHLFVLAGMPMRAVVPLFLCVIAIAALFGELVARYFSEPMNHL